MNNTYADNDSLKNGGGYYLESRRGRIMNDILWGNTCAHLGPQGFLYPDFAKNIESRRVRVL